MTHSPEQIPGWAKERACELLNVDLGDSNYLPWEASRHRDSPTITAFARYIAAHEEPPVDPLLIEARKFMRDYEPNFVFAEQYEAGERDTAASMKLALAALKRGIELGRASK